MILFRIEFKPAARQYAPVNRCIQFVLLLLASAALPAGAQGTAFNYQGRLNDAGAPANAAYDFQFTVYNAVANGSPVSAAVTNSAVAVSNGLFSVTLDFDPGIFTGTNYWLDLAVRAAGTTNFTELSPRQPVLPVPYAIFATGASNLLGTLAAAQLTGTLPSAQVAGTYSGLVNFSNATNSFSGAFAGNGAALTNLNATQLTAGTVADARLTTNMARLNTNQTFAGANSFPNAGNSFSGAFAGSGALLTNLNGSQVVAGTVADARLTTNVALLNASQTYTGSNTYTGANSFSGANSFTNNANTFTGSFFGNGLVGWIPVAGTSVQAARDTGYLLTNSQLTTVTLPLTASLLVGDIVRISGAGAGGWQVLANTNQSFIGAKIGWSAYFFQTTLVLDQPSPTRCPWHSWIAAINGIKGMMSGRFRLKEVLRSQGAPVVSSMTFTPHSTLPTDCPSKQSLQNQSGSSNQTSSVVTTRTVPGANPTTPATAPNNRPAVKPKRKKPPTSKREAMCRRWANAVKHFRHTR